MVNEDAMADGGAGVNLNASEKTRQMGGKAAKEAEAMEPEPMGQTMDPDGVEPRITEKNLQPAAGCRISGKDRLNILTHSGKHGTPPAGIY
jgi:hypothetical protein